MHSYAAFPFAHTMFWSSGPKDREFYFDSIALGNCIKKVLSGLLIVEFSGYTFCNIIKEGKPCNV